MSQRINNHMLWDEVLMETLQLLSANTGAFVYILTLRYALFITLYKNLLLCLAFTIAIR